MQEEQEEQGPNAIKRAAINRIENLMKKKNIKIEKLEPRNRDYRQVINNSGNTIDEILEVEDRIKTNINLIHIRESECENTEANEGESR